jgi:hypothetical protein
MDAANTARNNQNASPAFHAGHCSLNLPEHLSPEAHALFRAYQEVWNIEEAIRRRMGEPYWQVARAGIYSLLEAIVCMDDPEIGQKLKAKKRP